VPASLCAAQMIGILPVGIGRNQPAVVTDRNKHT
jgi:hypothetical protein